ncbi:MAG: LpxL/LpxP family acyltransferase [Gammaproteobacteria bacterium]
MKNWAQMEERGIIWGMRVLLKIYLCFGRQVLQIFLYPVVSYYWLINRKGRQASIEYLQRVASYLPEQSIRTGLYGSYLHFISFANAIIDKLAAWSGAITLQDVMHHGREEIQRHVDRGQGLLILGSHLGNLEVGRVIAYLGKKVTVNVLVHTKHAEKFNSLLNQYAEAGRMNLLQVTEINSATAMLLQDKIEAGELVVIAADRTPVTGHNRVSRADFLGKLAFFPQGPFILASLLKCPVYTLFCLKRQDKHVIYFDHFSGGLSFPRKQREAAIQRSVQDYAERLQEYCLQEPLQWFNFYDFWTDENA